MDSLPDDALTEILIRVNDPKVFAVCALVSRRWAKLLTAASHFWIGKCKRDNRVIPRILLGAAADRIDYRIIWQKNPYGRNLIKNDSGQEGFEHWYFSPENWNRNQTIHNGEAMRPIEKPPVNIDSVDITSCFASSYFDCTLTQKVDLWAEGVQSWILDELKPNIVVSQCYATRRDCGGRFNLVVELSNANGDICDDLLEVGADMPAGSDWTRHIGRFANYTESARYVSFACSGRDAAGWRGFFGVKMAKASVTLEFESEGSG